MGTEVEHPTEDRLRAALIVHGASGHGAVVADAALRSRKWSEVSATDRDCNKHSGELISGVVCGPPPTVFQDVHVAIGDPVHRERECDVYRQRFGIECLTSVLHPHASIGVGTTLGAGCFIAAGSRVGPRVTLGLSVIVNHNAVVDHDCVVGDFSHVAPNATLCGGVRLGRGVLIGAGAVVLPGVTIGDGVLVGAGSVVVTDLKSPGRYVGSPAREVSGIARALDSK